MPIARSISDLETTELLTRLSAYTNLQTQVFHLLCRRGVSEKVTTALMEDAAELALDELESSEESSAFEWMKFLVREAFTPVTDEPEKELARLQRYLLTASMVCTEAGDLPDDLPDE